MKELSSPKGVSIVISQPMYFPWVGMLEQIRLADVFVFYDDVQFSKGFFNRVQVKTQHGTRWMTIPLFNFHRGQLIQDVMIDNRTDWKEKHRGLLKHAYAVAPFYSEVMSLVDALFSRPADKLSEFSRASMLLLADYFGLTGTRRFYDASFLGIGGSSSRRLLDIVLKLHGKRYVTGHGARNYMDHELFEKNGVSIEYMNYAMKKYPQMYGEFTPYVSALDLVANCGRDGANVIHSGTLGWREFLASAPPGRQGTKSD